MIKSMERMSLTSVAERFAFCGRRALVTAGSARIGRALGLAEAGADVAIQSDLAADAAFSLPYAARDTCAAIAIRDRRTVAAAAVFRTQGEARRSVEEARRALGDLDILVIGASVQQREHLDEITAAEIERQFAINFAINMGASTDLLQACVPAMAARG